MSIIRSIDSEARGRIVGRCDVQRRAVGAERGLVEPGNVKRALPLGPGLSQDLVLAVGIDLAVVGQMADVGDVLAD